MKKLINSIYVAMVFVIATSCSNESKPGNNGDFLPPVKVEIPVELQGNKDAIALIETSEKAINEFSNNIETLIVENEDIWSKKSEDLSIMEQLTLAKTMAQFVVNSTEMASVMEKMNGTDGEEILRNLNDEQIKAFESVSKIFEERMNEIDEKYKDLVVE